MNTHTNTDGTCMCQCTFLTKVIVTKSLDLNLQALLLKLTADGDAFDDTMCDRHAMEPHDRSKRKCVCERQGCLIPIN